MEERHVTVDGEIYELPIPFMLLATQNPIDFEGTYVLPEAQLDRFMMKFSLGYPDEETENRMVAAQAKLHPIEQIKAVASVEEISALQEKAREVHMDDAVGQYAVSLTRKTREHASVFLGASPRATLALVQAAKAYSLLNGRDYVVPDDLKHLAPYVLGHRIILHADARMEGQTIESVLKSVFEQVRVPVRLEK